MAIKSVTVPPGGSTRLGGVGWLDAGEPGLDDLLQGVVVLVRLVLDVEVGGDGVHQGVGEAHFLGAQRDVLGGDAGRGADLVGPQEAVEQQGVIAHPDHGQRLAGAQGHSGDGDLVGIQHRLAQQRVRAGGGRGARAEEVGLVVVDRVDPGGVHEAQDPDLLGGGEREVGQVVAGQHHGAPVRRFVAAGDVLERHLRAVLLAVPPLLDPPAVRGVDQVQPDRVPLGGRVHAHRDRHQGHGDLQLRDGTGHRGLQESALLRPRSLGGVYPSCLW